MNQLPILVPIDPKEFWAKIKLIVEEAVAAHSTTALTQVLDKRQRPLMKANEVCALFKISKPTLYEWMNQGKLPSIKVGGRRFFKWEDVEALIERSRVKFPLFLKDRFD